MRLCSAVLLALMFLGFAGEAVAQTPPQITEVRGPSRVFTLPTKLLAVSVRLSGATVAPQVTGPPGDASSVVITAEPPLLRLAQPVRCIAIQVCIVDLVVASPTSSGKTKVTARLGESSKSLTVEVVVGKLTVTTDKRSYRGGEELTARISTNVPASEWPNGQMIFDVLSQGSGQILDGVSKFLPVVDGQATVAKFTVSQRSSTQLGIQIGVKNANSETLGSAARIDVVP